MKKSMISFAALLLTAGSLFATVHTVSNNTNSPGQFTTLQGAIDSAANGDTLYIHRSPFSYGSATIRKTLVLIGEGAMPDKQVQYTTAISSLNLTFAPFPATTTASGSKFYGLNIGSLSLSSAASSGTAAIGSITASRNLINNISIPSSLASSNLVLTNNIITTLGGGSRLFNSVISNNIIGSISYAQTTGFGSNVLISNNVITSRLDGTGAVVSNNVFYNYVSSGSLNISTTSSSFSNNIFYAFNPVTGTNITGGSNTGTGNQFNVDPKFVTPVVTSQLDGYTYINPTTGPFADLHLQPSSPGINYGTDGTDVGIYGGGYPWVDGSTGDSRYRYFTMPNNVPHMMEMNINNPTIQQNGTLNVQFKAKTQN